LYRNGQPLDDVVSWEEGIDSFFTWLMQNFPNGAILVAHGAFASDARLIVEDFQNSGWWDVQIKKVVLGFCDTLPAFKKHFPGKFYWINY
jgi:hypothetical protein